MTCKCMKCGKGYESQDIEDAEGYGKCVECAVKAKEIALRVDLEMARKRRENPIQQSRIRQLFSEEQIRNGDIAGAPRVNIRDLGITPHG